LKLNRREIFELQSLITKVNVPMKLYIDEAHSIDVDFVDDIKIHSIIKRVPEGYRIDYTNSNGSGNFRVEKDFNQFKYHFTQWLNGIKRDNPFSLNKLSNIESLSSNFYTVFQEAIIIENLGFIESSGMIFRKSLEVLVKDFLKNVLPDYEDLIVEKTIGSIIFHFYEKKDNSFNIKKGEKFDNIKNELNSIKFLIKKISNTFKIGNDFSHYERRLEKFSSKDMHDNIEIIIEFINSGVEKTKLTEKQSYLNIDFDKEKLI